jgi:Raf kinase inhibitor-like YbhB/YbcL family protein
MALVISSSAFAHQARIPRHYSGDGEDVSPPLQWSGVPATAKELALIADDPDAPTPEPWVHWVVYKIPVGAPGLPEGVPKAGLLSQPAGVLQGENSWREIGYRGPAPPQGHGMHHYHFKLYALDTALTVAAGLKKKTLLAAMQKHVMAEAEVIGTYDR